MEMEALYQFLPILIYVLLAILLVILIILGVKLIDTVNRTNDFLDDIEKKTQSLNSIFAAIDNVTDAVSLVGDKIVDGITSIVNRALNFRKRKKKLEDEENE